MRITQKILNDYVELKEKEKEIKKEIKELRDLCLEYLEIKDKETHIMGSFVIEKKTRKVNKFNKDKFLSDFSEEDYEKYLEENFQEVLNIKRAA